MDKILLEWTIVSWIANKMFPTRFKDRRLGEYLLSSSVARIIVSYIASKFSEYTFWTWIICFMYVDVLGYLQQKINNNKRG